MNELVWSDYLAMAAEDHCRATGLSGVVGHKGLSSSEPWDRLDRYGEWTGTVSENLAYGNIGGEEFMVELFIDDGVDDKLHRKNILNPLFKQTGMAVCPHTKYG